MITPQANASFHTKKNSNFGIRDPNFDFRILEFRNSKKDCFLPLSSTSDGDPDPFQQHRECAELGLHSRAKSKRQRKTSRQRGQPKLPDIYPDDQSWPNVSLVQKITAKKKKIYIYSIIQWKYVYKICTIYVVNIILKTIITTPYFISQKINSKKYFSNFYPDKRLKLKILVIP